MKNVLPVSLLVLPIVCSFSCNQQNKSQVDHSKTQVRPNVLFLFADAAIGFLNSYAKGKRENPFFCYVAFTAPHDPRSPRKDYIGMCHLDYRIGDIIEILKKERLFENTIIG